MTDVDITGEIAALRRAKPATAAEARVRATELCRLEGILHDAARKAIDAIPQKRLTNGNGSKPAGGKQAGGLSDEVLHALAEGIVPFISDVIAEAVAPLRKEISELKARPTLQDAGTWDETKVFHPGDIISHDGSAWICKEANAKARPGQSDCWRLLVKRGRDARGSR